MKVFIKYRDTFMRFFYENQNISQKENFDCIYSCSASTFGIDPKTGLSDDFRCRILSKESRRSS